MEKIRVKRCFGRWGDVDCFGLFNCGQYKKCSECYWDYYFSAKRKFGTPKFITEKIILKYCEKNNLELPPQKKEKEKDEII